MILNGSFADCNFSFLRKSCLSSVIKNSALLTNAPSRIGMSLSGTMLLTASSVRVSRSGNGWISCRRSSRYAWCLSSAALLILLRMFLSASTSACVTVTIENFPLLPNSKTKLDPPPREPAAAIKMFASRNTFT